MSMTDFEYEFYSKVHVDNDVEAKTERRLRDLADGHRDMIGASVAVEQPASGETGHLYRARIRAYVKQDTVVAVEKENSVRAALQGALNAVERQVREHRDEVRNY